MVNKGRGSNTIRFDWLSGGVTTYPDSHQVEMLSKNKLYLVDGQNIDYNKPGSWTKRQGFRIVDVALPGAGANLWEAQISTADSIPVTQQNNAQIVFCQKINAPSTAPIYSVIFPNYTITGGPLYVGKFKNIRVVWRVDNPSSPGNPGALVSATAVSESLIDGFQAESNIFTFPVPPTLTSGTDYWLCLEIETGVFDPAYALPLVSMYGTNTTGTFKYGANGYTGLSSATFSMGRFIYTSSYPVQGLYDYKVNSGSGSTQYPIACYNGNVKYLNGSNVWTGPIKTGLASGQNYLYDFETMKNMLVLCDSAQNTNQVWDGLAAGTSPHGYRGTFTIGQSASAGGPWSAAGVVQVMLVTQLTNGGYRASAVKSVTLGATTNKIDLSSIAIDSVDAQFGFNIAALATTCYCTTPNGSIFYKVPAAYMSAGGINPLANNDTAESILPMTDAQLIAGGSIESNLRLPTGYFTSQVDTPKSKYLQVFQDFLVMAGDPNNLSSIWVSEQYAPNIWSTYGKSYGVRIDISTDDGEIITGLAVADGALFVGKQHNIFRVDYTGDFNDPFRVRRVHGQLGVLSHWTLQVIPDGLFFLSERGPSICYGSYTSIIPQTSFIQDKFDNLSPTRYELSAMRYSTAVNDTSRNQVMLTTSSAGSTIRDGVLVYNYNDKSFMPWRGLYFNYLANITDTSNFPVVWGGDYSGNVYQRYEGYIDSYNGAPSSINGIFVIMYGVTPDLDFGEPNMWKEAVFLELAGYKDTGSAESYLLVDVYLDKATTPKTTLVYDMRDTRFKTGMVKAIPGKFKTIKLRIRNSAAANESAVEIYWLRFSFALEGVRY